MLPTRDRLARARALREMKETTDNLPSGSQSLPQRHNEEEETTATFAKQLWGHLPTTEARDNGDICQRRPLRMNAAEMEQWPTEEPRGKRISNPSGPKWAPPKVCGGNIRPINSGEGPRIARDDQQRAAACAYAPTSSPVISRNRNRRSIGGTPEA